MVATATASPPEWTLLYHSPGKIKGRGEFLRLMLEDAGISYVDSGDNLYGPSGMMDAFRGSPDAVDVQSSPYPIFFPPALWHRPGEGEEVLINQVAACMMYLGDQLGYAPQNVAEKARANCILLNALDYVSEGRCSFHPVKNSMSYHDQKEQGDKASKEFSELRMQLFLHHFNKVVKSNSDGPQSPVAGGSKLTHADFALFHALDATASQFNSDFYEYAWDKAAVPELKMYYEWMKARPNLQAYFQSDRCARKYWVDLTLLFGTYVVHTLHLTIYLCVEHSVCWRQHDVTEEAASCIEIYIGDSADLFFSYMAVVRILTKMRIATIAIA